MAKLSAGLPPAALQAVNEFTTAIEEGTIEERDRYPRGAHSLVVLVETALEAITGATFRSAIVGFSRSSEERLVKERRRLERQGERESLQRLLFAFEQLCPVLRESGYADGSSERATTFFVELFPAWLESLSLWAKDEGFAELGAEAEAVLDRYVAISEEVVDAVDGG